MKLSSKQLLKGLLLSLRTNFPGMFMKTILLNPAFTFRYAFKAVGAFIDTRKVRILDKEEFHQLDEEIPKDQREQKFGGRVPDLKVFFPPTDSYPSSEKLTLLKIVQDRKVVPFFFSMKKYTEFMHLVSGNSSIPAQGVPNDDIYQDFRNSFVSFGASSHHTPNMSGHQTPFTGSRHPNQSQYQRNDGHQNNQRGNYGYDGKVEGFNSHPNGLGNYQQNQPAYDMNYAENQVKTKLNSLAE